MNDPLQRPPEPAASLEPAFAAASAPDASPADPAPAEPTPAAPLPSLPPVPPVAPPTAHPPAAAEPPPGGQRWQGLAWGAVALMALAALVMAWQAQSGLKALEPELVKRQQATADQAAEARLLAKQSQELVRDTASKVALLESRVAEVALQRTQLEELIQSLSRSRDENVITDIDASLRVAMQQSAITGSAEPLVAALRSADERLARVSQPRLERVRRAITRDLDRVRAVGVPDIGSLLIKLDEAVRLVDDLPLLGDAKASRGPAPTRQLAATAPRAASAPASPASWWAQHGGAIAEMAGVAWNEARQLLRVTRIQQPEAMLVAPEQALFLRENIKLRVLNARLALLSRQAETARGDLEMASGAVQRYFDPDARRTQVTLELLRQAATQSRQVGIPRPDETLAAISAAVAGR